MPFYSIQDEAETHGSWEYMYGRISVVLTGVRVYVIAYVRTARHTVCTSIRYIIYKTQVEIFVIGRFQDFCYCCNLRLYLLLYV